MPVKQLSVVSAVLMFLVAPTASAFWRVPASEPSFKLILEPTSETLVPETFDYRFDSTSTSRAGCYQRDFLTKQRIPLNWLHSTNMTPADGAYVATFARTRTEKKCAAKAGLYNYVSVVWTNPQDPSHTYRGVMQIDAGGTASFDEVRCFLSNPAEPFNSLECEQAVVSFANGPVTIVMHLDDLP